MLFLAVMELFLLQQVQKNAPHVQIELGLVQAPLQVVIAVEIIAQAVMRQDAQAAMQDIKFLEQDALLQ